MANEERCVFCGQTVSAFRSTNILCGNTYQICCKSCAKELNALEHTERCSRALLRGLAYRPEQLREYIQIHGEAEKHRPQCPSCGGKLRFLGEQSLDASPLNDSIFSSFLPVVTACCDQCGRYDFFNPEIVRKNPFLNHLLLKDTAKE